MTVDRDAAQPLYQQIAGVLRDGIHLGHYAPGRRLPSESELMSRYGVARLTARHAVRVLTDAGLAEVIPGRGVYVRAA